MATPTTKQKTKEGSRKQTTTLHDKDMKDSSEYTEGAHDVVGEDARKSRNKARQHNEKLI